MPDIFCRTIPVPKVTEIRELRDPARVQKFNITFNLKSKFIGAKCEANATVWSQKGLDRVKTKKKKVEANASSRVAERFPRPLHTLSHPSPTPLISSSGTVLSPSTIPVWCWVHPAETYPRHDTSAFSSQLKYWGC